MGVRGDSAGDRSSVSRRQVLAASAVGSLGVLGTGPVASPAAAGVRAGVAADVPPIEDGRVAGIARLGDRLVAVGQASSGGTAWVRAEGESWRRITDGFGEAAVPAAITAYGDRLLAVGSLGGRSACWVSNDGSTWRPMVANGPAGVLCGVATAGSEALAVGQRADGETAEGAGALVVRSVDGQSWDPVDNFGLPGGSESGLTAVSAYAGTWIAASHTVAGATLWQSGDGRAWSPAAAPAEAGVVISGLTATAGTLVAVGSTIADTQPRLWVRRDSKWTEVRSIRAGAVEDGVLHAAVPLGADGSILLVGTRAGRSVTVASDEF